MIDRSRMNGKLLSTRMNVSLAPYSVVRHRKPISAKHWKANFTRSFGGVVAEAPEFLKNCDKAGAAHGVFALQRLDAAVIAFNSQDQWRECMAAWHARDGDVNLSLNHAFSVSPTGAQPAFIGPSAGTSLAGARSYLPVPSLKTQTQAFDENQSKSALTMADLNKNGSFSDAVFQQQQQQTRQWHDMVRRYVAQHNRYQLQLISGALTMVILMRTYHATLRA